MIYSRGGRAAIDESVYPDLEEFWADTVAAYGEELRRARRARLHATSSSTTRASRCSATRHAARGSRRAATTRTRCT